MEEIYWLQRLGAISTVMWVVFVLSFICLIIALICYIAFYGDDYCEDEVKKSKLCIKWLIPIAFISACGLVFIPTTKEMYVIYGVGGTIDYLKENETAKQLPGKVINALDKWVEELNDEE